MATQPLLALHATPIAPFGAEVRFDLRQPLDEDGQRALRSLFYRYRLLLFRDQQLTLDDQRRVMSAIGPLDPDDAALAYLKPDDGVLGDSELNFHSDLAFVPHPPEALSLHAIDVVEGETYTAFVDAIGGFRRLPAALADRMRAAMTERVATYSQKEGDIPPHESPPGTYTLHREAVIAHPETDEPILYIARGATARVIGLDQPESRALLDDAMAHLYDEAHVLRLYWRTGDFAMWDNYALQHARPPLTGVTRRTLQRVTSAKHSQRAQMPSDYIAPADMEAAE